MSGWPSDIMGTEPKVSGNIQLQQTSVMGFMKRPWQVGPAAAGAAMMRFASRAMRAKPRVMSGLQQFIDAQLLAVLRDERRDVTDPELRGETAVLIEVHRLLQAAHECEIRPAGQDQL